MQTSERLERMRKLINRIPAAKMRVLEAESAAARVTRSLTGVPRGGAGDDKMAQSVERIMDAKKKRDDMILELQAHKVWLIPLIDTLPKPEQKQIMEMRYIDEHSARDIAYKLNYAERTVFHYLTESEKSLQSLQ